MAKIYTDMNAFEEAQEREFVEKVAEVNSIYGSCPRTTLDCEWEEDELKDDVYSEAKKLLEGTKDTKGLAEQYSNRALKNKNLLLVNYLVEEYCSSVDLIEVYNTEYDKHRNDKPMNFGIHYFDDKVISDLKKILKDNLYT